MEKVNETHWEDENGNPAGGCTYGQGFTISWQNGPLGRVEDGTRIQPNGAFVEDVIKAAIGRLEFYQKGKFASPYNARAIEHLQSALQECNNRTADREERKVEGTHEQ